MNAAEQLHKLLDAAGIEHFEMDHGVFLCGGASDIYARVASYVTDESRFQVTLEGLTPAQAFAALNAAIKEDK